MSKPLRIAMIAACPFPWPRGTPIRIHRMAEALAHNGHDVHVVTYHLGETPADLPFTIHRIRDVPAYRRTEPGPTLRKLIHLDPMMVRLLRRLHSEIDFDVVHAHHYEGILIASRAGKHRPIIYDAHTTLAGELPQYRLGLPCSVKRSIGSQLDRRLPRRAHHTIAVSQTIRDILVWIKAARADQVEVIPNGVEWRHFVAQPAPGFEAPLIIFTGNTSRYQRVDLLIEAFALLHRRRPHARLLIVTDSTFAPYEDQARQLGVRQAIDLCNATFDEQPALLAAADVAANPRTECDGIPQKLLNYMAAGKPIVSFEGSAVMLKHEVTGLRVANGDTQAMASAMLRLLDDRALAKRLGDAARQQMQQEFSWDSVARRVEAVYRATISSFSGHAAEGR
ncbi:MAG: glycosyltransferase family 4 protein [Phycisphaeraceae bacterium]|nr:glycosyltransferase family 4 protein [Phycisphaeraceae bacterium]